MTAKATIPWEGGEVTGRLEGSGKTGVLLAHGAGTDQDHPTIVGIRRGLSARGLAIMTFNYPYTERGAKRPDRTEKLVACHRGAADYLRSRVDSLFLAGRSMGGRIGTVLISEGDVAAGAILYAYPLHPPGKPESLRVDHLSMVHVPLLFFQGTRDALSRMDLFEKHVAHLPNVSVEILDEAGHGMRGGGWTPETIVERYVERSAEWIEGVSPGTTAANRP